MRISPPLTGMKLHLHLSTNFEKEGIGSAFLRNLQIVINCFAGEISNSGLFYGYSLSPNLFPKANFYDIIYNISLIAVFITSLRPLTNQRNMVFNSEQL